MTWYFSSLSYFCFSFLFSILCFLDFSNSSIPMYKNKSYYVLAGKKILIWSHKRIWILSYTIHGLLLLLKVSEFWFVHRRRTGWSNIFGQNQLKIIKKCYVNIRMYGLLYYVNILSTYNVLTHSTSTSTSTSMS